MKKAIYLALYAGLALGFTALPLSASDTPPGKVEGYTDTPLLPGGKWHVHDPNRPQPTVITPGTFSSQEKPGQPPSDAIVLFDGKDLSQWRDVKGQPTKWVIDKGEMVVTPKSGDAWTKQEFGDMQLHVEFSEPSPAKGNGQGRGNSGVFLMGKYEVQVLDCYGNQTYPDGQTAALYGMHPPMVNACLKPGEWQVYDIVYTVPRFEKDGKLIAPGYVTVIQNGVVVQNHADFLGASGHRNLATYKAHPPTGPLKLQDHGNPVRFRNIWVRPLQPES